MNLLCGRGLVELVEFLIKDCVAAVASGCV